MTATIPLENAVHRQRGPALIRAIDTMMRGAAFLQDREAALAAQGVSTPDHRARVLGNSLCEVDRFLHLLLDELAAASGMAGHALQRLRRRRTVTAKLAAYPGLFGHRVDDRARLLALAAQRSQLLSGAIESGRRCNAVLLARRAPTPLPSIDLHEVSAYYSRLAAHIVRHVEQPRAAGQSDRAQLRPTPGARPASAVSR